MAVDPLILVVNPGSASRKYALYAGNKLRATFHFEFEDGAVIGTFLTDGQREVAHYNDSDLRTVSRHVLPLLQTYQLVQDRTDIVAIGVRVVAPSQRFLKDQLVTDQVVEALEDVKHYSPLHVTVTLAEIRQLRRRYTSTPIVIISDSAFHATKLPLAWYYGIDTELADDFDIKRYGYHGISVGSVTQYLQNHGYLKPKAIICHLGSGCSVTAVKDGASFDTTMGYTPLEGVLMATRSGNIDIAAALLLQRRLDITDNELEKYLNSQSGLLGVSGRSDDIRQLLKLEKQGHKRASLAINLFVYRIQQAIGQMAASLNGADSLVFTATVGERSAPIRQRICDGLDYLGFRCSKPKNEPVFEPTEAVNIATETSRPIYVVSTEEAVDIATRVRTFLKI